MMTAFSVCNLARNNELDFSKTKEEQGYTTRSYQKTIHDEVQRIFRNGGQRKQNFNKWVLEYC